MLTLYISVGLLICCNGNPKTSNTDTVKFHAFILYKLHFGTERNNTYLPMKAFLISLGLLLSLSTTNAQDVTKKWNNIYKRYEYYNSRGNLTGYEKWSSIYNRWEYFNAQPQSNNNGYKYPDYQSPYDIGLIERVLSQKQQVFNQKVKNVQNKVNNIQNLMLFLYDNCEITDKQSDDFQFYNNQMVKITNSMIDQNYNSLMDWLNKAETDIINLNYTKYDSKIKEKSSQPTKKKNYEYGELCETYTNSPILDKPEKFGSSDNGKVIARVTSGTTIKIIEKVPDYVYYKIQYGNIIGYLWDGWIK